MFWFIVRLVEKWGGPIGRSGRHLQVGPLALIIDHRTEANRKSWLIREQESELATRVMEPLIWGKEIQQLVVSLPKTGILPRVKIFERYAPKGADDKWML